LVRAAADSPSREPPPIAKPRAAADSQQAGSRAHRREPPASREPPPPTIADCDVRAVSKKKTGMPIGIPVFTPQAIA